MHSASSSGACRTIRAAGRSMVGPAPLCTGESPAPGVWLARRRTSQSAGEVPGGSHPPWSQDTDVRLLSLVHAVLETGCDPERPMLRHLRYEQPLSPGALSRPVNEATSCSYSSAAVSWSAGDGLPPRADRPGCVGGAGVLDARRRGWRRMLACFGGTGLVSWRCRSTPCRDVRRMGHSRRADSEGGGRRSLSSSLRCPTAVLLQQRSAGVREDRRFRCGRQGEWARRVSTLPDSWG